MGSTNPAKFVLKSTTKLSLNDRFSAYRKNTATLTSVRQRMQQTRQATARNRRLAQQMENRPSVIAALKLKKKSLKQRLGQAVQFRFPTNRGALGRFRGVNRIRGNFRGRIIRDGSRLRRRASFMPQMSNRIGSPLNLNQRGTVNRRAMRRGGRGVTGGVSFRGNNFAGGQFRNRGGQRRGFVRPTAQVAGRGGRIRRGKLPTKQELDNDLDEYMSKTKSHLDAELEAYMSQATD